MDEVRKQEPDSRRAAREEKRAGGPSQALVSSSLGTEVGGCRDPVNRNSG